MIIISFSSTKSKYTHRRPTTTLQVWIPRLQLSMGLFSSFEQLIYGLVRSSFYQVSHISQTIWFLNRSLFSTPSVMLAFAVQNWRYPLIIAFW